WNLARAVGHPVDAAHVPEIEVAELLLALNTQGEDLRRRHRGVSTGDLESASQHRVDYQPPRGAAASKLGGEDHVFATPGQRGDPPGGQLQGEVVHRIAEEMCLLGIDR